VVEQGGGEVRTWSVFASLAPYTLMLVSRKKWEQHHGNLPEPSNTHINSPRILCLPQLSSGRVAMGCDWRKRATGITSDADAGALDTI